MSNRALILISLALCISLAICGLSALALLDLPDGSIVRIIAAVWGYGCAGLSLLIGRTAYAASKVSHIQSSGSLEN